jgi:hypothetical protein
MNELIEFLKFGVSIAAAEDISVIIWRGGLIGIGGQLNEGL